VGGGGRGYPRSVSAPELSVVCRSCGEEVSPYVTECPYCGTRIRKRAPKLELRGDELAPHERRRRRLRLLPRIATDRAGERRYATLAAIAVPAVSMLALTALNRPATDFGAIVGAAGSDWWRYLAAPFVYTNLGYLFVIAVAVAIFGPAVESRLGSVATAALILACGALGMVCADAIEDSLNGSDVLLAAGGNGVALGLLAAWAVMKAAEVRESPDEEAEVIGAAVAASVLVLLPVVVDWASVFAGLGGALVGAACGLVAAIARREKSAG
jgi:membrane associated rhomboid family serine protease